MMRPCESAIAKLLSAPCNDCRVVIVARPGSGTCVQPLKYVTTPGLPVRVTCPALFGRGTTISGKFKLLAVPSPYGLNPALIVNGGPEFTLKIPPNCQRSTKRCTVGGAFASSMRF